MLVPDPSRGRKTSSKAKEASFCVDRVGHAALGGQASGQRLSDGQWWYFFPKRNRERRSSVRTCVHKHGQLRTAKDLGWSWDEVEREEIRREPIKREATTTKKRRRKLPLLASRVSEDRDLMKAVLREVVQEVLEGEMPEPLGAAPRGSAQKAGNVSGPAITAGVW